VGTGPVKSLSLKSKDLRLDILEMQVGMVPVRFNPDNSLGKKK